MERAKMKRIKRKISELKARARSTIIEFVSLIYNIFLHFRYSFNDQKPGADLERLK